MFMQPTHIELTLKEFLAEGVELVRCGLISVRIIDQKPAWVGPFTFSWKGLRKKVPPDFMPGCGEYTIASCEAALEILNAGAMAWAKKRVEEE